MSQLILQTFCCFTCIAALSPKPSFASRTSQALHSHHLVSHPCSQHPCTTCQSLSVELWITLYTIDSKWRCDKNSVIYLSTGQIHRLPLCECWGTCISERSGWGRQLVLPVICCVLCSDGGRGQDVHVLVCHTSECFLHLVYRIFTLCSNTNHNLSFIVHCNHNQALWN